MKDYFEYTILYEHGGFFLDYDTMCVKPMDELAYRYRFFGHLEPWSLLNEESQTNVGVMGSEPGNPIALALR